MPYVSFRQPDIYLALELSRSEFAPELKSLASLTKTRSDINLGSALIEEKCWLILDLVREMSQIPGIDVFVAQKNQHRSQAHIRHIAIYICHVCLRIGMNDIAQVFSLDRKTVSYACARIEDRRDEEAFDMFIGRVERIAALIFFSGIDRGETN